MELRCPYSVSIPSGLRNTTYSPYEQHAFPPAKITVPLVAATIAEPTRLYPSISIPSGCEGLYGLEIGPWIGQTSPAPEAGPVSTMLPSPDSPEPPSVAGSSNGAAGGIV